MKEILVAMCWCLVWESFCWDLEQVRATPAEGQVCQLRGAKMMFFYLRTSCWPVWFSSGLTLERKREFYHFGPRERSLITLGKGTKALSSALFSVPVTHIFLQEPNFPVPTLPAETFPVLHKGCKSCSLFSAFSPSPLLA